MSSNNVSSNSLQSPAQPRAKQQPLPPNPAPVRATPVRAPVHPPVHPSPPPVASLPPASSRSKNSRSLLPLHSLYSLSPTVLASLFRPPSLSALLSSPTSLLHGPLINTTTTQLSGTHTVILGDILFIISTCILSPLALDTSAPDSLQNAPLTLFAVAIAVPMTHDLHPTTVPTYGPLLGRVVEALRREEERCQYVTRGGRVLNGLHDQIIGRRRTTDVEFVPDDMMDDEKDAPTSNKWVYDEGEHGEVLRCFEEYCGENTKRRVGADLFRDVCAVYEAFIAQMRCVSDPVARHKAFVDGHVTHPNTMPINESVEQMLTQVMINDRVVVRLHFSPKEAFPRADVDKTLVFPAVGKEEIGLRTFPPDMLTVLDVISPVKSLGVVAQETAIDVARVVALAQHLIDLDLAVCVPVFWGGARFGVSRKGGGVRMLAEVEVDFKRRFGLLGAGEGVVFRIVSDITAKHETLGAVCEDEDVLKNVEVLYEDRGVAGKTVHVLIDMCVWLRAKGVLVELDEFLFKGAGGSLAGGSLAGGWRKNGSVGLVLEEEGGEEEEEEVGEFRKILDRLEEGGGLKDGLRTSEAQRRLGVEGGLWGRFKGWAEKAGCIQFVLRIDE